MKWPADSLDIEKVQEIDLSKNCTLVLSVPGLMRPSDLLMLANQIKDITRQKVIVLEEGIKLDAVLVDDKIHTDGY